MRETRAEAIAVITATQDTYLTDQPQGVYVDRGAMAGEWVTGANHRRLIIADVAGSLWFGGVQVTDPDVIDRLIVVLGGHADRMRTRSEK